MPKRATATLCCLLGALAASAEEPIAPAPPVGAPAPSATLDEPDLALLPGGSPRAFALLNGLELWEGASDEWVGSVRGYARPGARRLAVEVDGHPVFSHLLSGTDLPATVPLLGQSELSRGPMTALAGPDAGGGRIALTRRGDPGPGGELRLGLGNLSTLNLEAGWRRGLDGGGRLSAAGSFRRNERLSRSRVDGVEYSRPCFGISGRETDCLPLEASPLGGSERRVVSLGAGWERPLGDLGSFALFLDGSEETGSVLTTDLGRLERGRARRLGLRGRFERAAWEARGTFGLLEERGNRLMGSGRTLNLDQQDLDLTLTRRFSLARDRAQARVELSFRHEEADLLDVARGVSLLQGANAEQVAGLAMRLDAPLFAWLSASLAVRWQDEDSSGRGAGRVALAASLGRAGQLTLSAGQGLTRATLLERHLTLPVADPVDLSHLERFCAPSGVDCGFAGEPIPVLAAGNPGLEPVESRSLDLGWQAKFGRLSLSLSAWRGREEVLSDLLPALGTELGRVSPDFGPYRPPSALPAAAAGALLVGVAREVPSSLAPFLTLDEAGRPVFVVLTWGVVAEVDTVGLDLGLELRWTPRLRLLGRYSFADFELPESAGTLAVDSLPGSPQHQASAALLWQGDRLAGSLVGRWVDGYRSVRGPFRGTVPTWYTLDAGLSVRLTPRARLRLEVIDLLDRRYVEVFGGDLLERRGQLSAAWAF